MHYFYLMEIIIFVLFVLCVKFFAVSRNRVFAFFSAFTASALLEIANEVLFSTEGTYYPDSFLYFPFFRFPLAIVCLGSFYSYCISMVCLKFSKYFNSYTKKIAVFIIAAFVLNFTSLLIESAGMYSGYWIHKKATDISEIWYFVYLFYLVISFSGAFFIFPELKKNK